MGKIKGHILLIVVNEKILMENNRKHGLYLRPFSTKGYMSVLKLVQKQKRESGKNEASVSMSLHSK